MLAVMLDGLGMAPSYIVGGVIANLGSNAGAGRGRQFVIEADEYDRAFLGLYPDVAVVTNLEMDHPDCFPTLGDMQQAFAEFLAQVKPGGYVVACGDSPALGQVLSGLDRRHVRLVTYGCDGASDVWVRDIAAVDGDTTFALWRDGEMWQHGRLAVPGAHNALNAAAALIVADICGLDVEAAAAVLETFQGTARRFQLKGEARGVTVIDDYAHHPTEVRATLAAARLRYPGRRLWAVLQPHTYSRLEALFDEFAACFDDADRVIVTDVYAARAKEQPTVRAADLVAAMRHPAVEHVAALDQVVDHLLSQLDAGDVLITLGAGDGYLIGERVLRQLVDGCHG
jgi:UDP-N-acetylmuramate--alanine ligase